MNSPDLQALIWTEICRIAQMKLNAALAADGEKIRQFTGEDRERPFCPHCLTTPNGGDRACETAEQIKNCAWATKEEKKRAITAKVS